MAKGRLRRYYLNLGGTIGNLGAIKWGFRAPKDCYKGIGSGVGVTEVSDNDRNGIVYGVNTPRPVRISITFVSADGGGGEGNDNIGHAKRFCDPDTLNDVLFGSLNGLKVNVNGADYDIENVTQAS